MAGLGPAIHAFALQATKKTWVARAKCGHDALIGAIRSS